MTRRFTSRVGAVFWYGGSGLIVAVAVLITLARVVVPAAEGYRHRIELLVSGFLGQQVQIGDIDARLIGFTPTLVLDDVALLDEQRERALIDVQQALLALDLWGSLTTLRPVTREITLVGARVAMTRNSAGGLQVLGLNPPPDQAVDGGFGAWLLAQGRLALRDSQVRWSGDGNTADFDAVDLVLVNRGDRHLVSGSLQLPGNLGHRLAVAAEIEGMPFSGPDWEGTGYIEGSGLQLARWVPPTRVSSVTDGKADLRLWFDWRQGTLNRVQGEFELVELVIAGRERRAEFDRIAARAHWGQQPDGWRFVLERLQVQRDGRPWEPSRAELVSHNSGRTTVKADFLRLEDAAVLVPLLPWADPAWGRQLAVLEPRGDLARMRLDLGGPEGPMVSLQMRDLSVRSHGQWPGAEGLDADLRYAAGKGEVSLHTLDGRLLVPSLFRWPLETTALNGRLRIERNAGGWHVQTSRLALVNADLALQLSGALELPDGESPFLDLRGVFRDARAVRVPLYLPVHRLRPEAVSWLDRAFLAGEATSGGLLFHGRTRDFPFDNGEGRFEVRFETQGVDLSYIPGWPMLQDVAAEVVFANRGLWIRSRRGRLLNSAIDNVRVHIPNLKKSRLYLDGAVHGPALDAVRYLRGSPLGSRFDAVLAAAKVGGNSSLELHLERSFVPPDEDPGFRLDGQFHLPGNDLRLGPLDFHDLSGRLHFTEDSWESDRIAGTLGARPAHLTVYTSGSGSAAVTHLALRGRGGAEQLASTLTHPLIDRVTGNAEFQATLSVPHSEGDQGVLRFASDLRGLGLELPVPLGKNPESVQRLLVEAQLSGERTGQVKVALGNRFSALLDTGQWEGLERAAVNFGAEPPRLPSGRAIAVSGSLHRAVTGEWRQVLAGLSVPGSAPSLPVRLDMDDLYLVAGGPSSDNATPLSTLPPLQIRIGRLTYDRTPLGRFALDLVPVGSGGAEVRDFRIEGEAFRLELQGDWVTGDDPQSRFSYRLDSPDFGAAMRNFGVASIVTSGRTALRGEVQWPGAPGDLSLERLSGRVQVSITDGVLEDVDPGAGRLLGLLSLEALPRRLMLDFRDLFEKGMRFQTISGDFVIADGQAQTENLFLHSLPASVLVTGRTGLITRDYDQIVTVFPELTDSLAVAGGVALGPQVGAALLLFQNIFKAQISRATQIQYEVTGPWSDPSVVQLRRNAQRTLRSD